MIDTQKILILRGVRVLLDPGWDPVEADAVRKGIDEELHRIRYCCTCLDGEKYGMIPLIKLDDGSEACSYCHKPTGL